MIFLGRRAILSNKNNIYIWDMVEKKLDLHSLPVTNIMLTKAVVWNNSIIFGVSTSGFGTGICIFQPDNLKHEIFKAPFAYLIFAIAIKENQLFVGDTHGRIQMFSLLDKQWIKPIRRGDDYVYDLSIDGQILVGHCGTKVLLWNLKNFECIGDFDFYDNSGEPSHVIVQDSKLLAPYAAVKMYDCLAARSDPDDEKKEESRTYPSILNI